MALKDATLRLAELEQQVAHLTNWITALVNNRVTGQGVELGHLPQTSFDHPALISPITDEEWQAQQDAKEVDAPAQQQPQSGQGQAASGPVTSAPLAADTEPTQA